MRGKGYWRQIGLVQIERELARVDRCLQSTHLSLVDRLFWQGRRRELQAAAWLIQRIITPPASNSMTAVFTPAVQDQIVAAVPAAISIPLPERLVTANRDYRDLQNVTDRPLELDILQPGQRQQLLRAVTQQLSETLAELAKVTPAYLDAAVTEVLIDAWLGSATRFFGRYYTLTVGNQTLEVLGTIGLDRAAIGQRLIQQIPLSRSMWGYLVWQEDIAINNQMHSYGSIPANEYVADLLTNATLQIANAVLAPFINRFGEVEAVKEQFYRPEMLVTRDIARFRNHLSWQAYLERQYRRPVDIFESRHQLLICQAGEIQTRSIYAPRRQELAQLRGIPWLVTMLLEFRDAVTPLATATSTLLGNLVVYVLTEIIGRGLGLVGRGILQGLGQAWPARPRS
jgi:Protein of unknown function (DUF3685)